MKKIYLSLALVLSIFMFTGCVFVVDDETPSATVKIENRDPDREAYIKSVEYCRNYSSDWVNCWNYSNCNTDSNCSFAVASGDYQFRITVIYPKYDGRTDYYGVYETDSWEKIRINPYGSARLVFNGSELYSKY